jgi:hypothetical protein
MLRVEMLVAEADLLSTREFGICDHEQTVHNKLIL